MSDNPTRPHDLKAFQKMKGWSNNRFSKELGVTPNTLRDMKKRKGPVRRVVGLALHALEAELPPWRP